MGETEFSAQDKRLVPLTKYVQSRRGSDREEKTSSCFPTSLKATHGLSSDNLMCRELNQRSAPGDSEMQRKARAQGKLGHVHHGVEKDDERDIGRAYNAIEEEDCETNKCSLVEPIDLIDRGDLRNSTSELRHVQLLSGVSINCSQAKKKDNIEKCIENLESISMKRGNSVRLSGRVANHLGIVCNELSSCKNELDAAFEAALNLQMSLSPTSSVHLLVETDLIGSTLSKAKEQTSIEFQKNLVSLPVFSPTLTRGLAESEYAEKIKSLMSELFALADKATDNSTSNVDVEEVPVTEKSVDSKVFAEISLPEWYPHDGGKAKEGDAAEIVCEPSLIAKLGEIRGTNLADAYGMFIRSLHKKAQTLFDFVGPLAYEHWTPAWLRKIVSFRLGRLPTTYATLSYGVIPRKQVCAALKGRPLCRSILSEWLLREPGTKALLLHCLRKYDPDISERFLENIGRQRKTKASRRLIGLPAQNEFTEEKSMHPVVNCSSEKKREAAVVADEEASLQRQDKKKNRATSEGNAAAISCTERCSMFEGLYKPRGKKCTEVITLEQLEELYQKAQENDHIPEAVVVRVGGHPITQKDLDTLKCGQWLNDNIMNAFFFFLDSENVYVINSFLHFILHRDGAASYNALSEWIQKERIERCKVSILPVYMSSHWGLVVLNKENARVQFFDSMNGQMFESAARELAAFGMSLKDKLNLKNWPRKWTASKSSEPCPQQTNTDDCGVFSCITALFISKGMPLVYSPSDIPGYRVAIARSISAGTLLFP